MIIFNVDEGFQFKLSDKLLLKKWIKAVAADFGNTVGDISYMFCSDDKILEVNKQYLSHDYYTDIITFDYVEGTRLSGDIFISVDTVRSNAEKFSQSFENELHRVIIHGVLHLCGLKDKTPSDEANMHAAEDKALEKFALLKIQNDI